MASRVGSTGTALSSSSLSLPASVDTFSAVLHLRAPQFAARSPSLLKANRGIAEAAAIRGPVPPCVFTLRGKRQTREQDAVQHESGGGRAAAAASSSPRRPPYRVNIGQGYSMRLRRMGTEYFMHGSKTTKKASRPAGAAFVNTIDAACGAAAATECNAMASSQPALQPCQDVSTASERDPLVDSGAETNETTANLARGNQEREAETPGSACIPERPVANSRADSLCGRLWTGTTASPKSEVVRPRILFLVSGQQQQIQDPPRTTIPPPCGERRRSHKHNTRSDPVITPFPPPARARNSKTAVPRGRTETAASSGWRCDDARIGQESESEGRGGEERDNVLPPGSGCGLGDGEECYDAATTAATDGKGDDSVRRVLHVRVPHPPPTSLLVFRSPPPTTP